jgi:hypothetical protein
MKKYEIEAKFEIGQTVHYMSGREIPRKGIVEGFNFLMLDDYGELKFDYLVNNVPQFESDLFASQEEMLAKRRTIAPSRAALLLKRHENQPISWLTEADIAYLNERIKALDKSKITKRNKSTE